MRTFELHAHVKSISRSAGRSSVAAAAYRAGEKLEDQRTGLAHDYTRKTGVQQSEIYMPKDAPEWTTGIERQELWNRVEAKENRKNSMTARELEISFPSEFNHEQRIEAGRQIAGELIKRYNCAVDISWHAPDKKGDDRNHHAHIMFTTRGLDTRTKDGWSKSKSRQLSSDTITIDGKKTTRSAQEVSQLREIIARTMNRIAIHDEMDVRTEYLSFDKRSIDRDPTQKMGQHATKIEREGKESERGNSNREIQATNDVRQKTKETAKIISFGLEKAKRELAKEKNLANKVSDSREKWFIDEWTARYHEKKAELEKKKSSFWSRLFKQDQKVEQEFKVLNNRLVKNRLEWGKDIHEIYSNEPLKVRREALREHGFTMKEPPRPQKSPEPKQHLEQALTPQYNEKTKDIQQRQRPKAAKPPQERERNMDFER